MKNWTFSDWYIAATCVALWVWYFIEAGKVWK